MNKLCWELWDKGKAEPCGTAWDSAAELRTIEQAHDYQQTDRADEYSHDHLGLPIASTSMDATNGRKFQAAR